MHQEFCRVGTAHLRLQANRQSVVGDAHPSDGPLEPSVIQFGSDEYSFLIAAAEAQRPPMRIRSTDGWQVGGTPTAPFG